MKLEEAIEELKNIWKETDFENSKRRIAIETILQELGITQKKLELAIDQNISYKQNIKDLKRNSIPKKKIKDKIKYLEDNEVQFSEGNRIENEIYLLEELLEDK